jgi:non-homologous end joining protein Ku
MAPRSNWKGYLKLSLVSASIAIYPATSSSEKVRFNTLNRATGNRFIGALALHAAGRGCRFRPGR